MIDLLSTAPPEYPGIEEAMKSIYRDMWTLRQEIQGIKAAMSFLTYTVDEIAKELKCSPWTLRKNIWMLPNYGRPDIGAHPRRWFYDTVNAWYHIPEDERKRKWEAMSSTERRQMMGKIA
jgi:hypothetical protein